MRTAIGRFCTIASLLTIGATSLLAQQAAAPAIKLERPEVRDNAVVIASAFWNEGVADWLEAAISGRPSEFLHETLICIPTTQTDVISAMRQIGFRNATDLAKNFEIFKQIRGDRALLLLEVTREDKTETYLLEELMEFRGWGTAVAPLGFCFKGTAPGAANQPAETPAPGAPMLSDAQRILMDDPQAALTFKGLQHVSRSFLDFSLAYDDWLFPPLAFGRNTALLSLDVFNSNGKVPVKLIIKKATEAQAMEAVAQYWHEPQMKAAATKLLPLARQIDEAKETYLKTTNGREKSAAFLAIQAGYARMDAALVQCALSQSAFKGEAKDIAAQKKQAAQFTDHLERTAVYYEQQQAAFEKLGTLPEMYEHHARSLIASNEDQLVYWQEQKDLLDPKDDPRKDWVTRVNLELAHLQAALDAAKLELTLAEKTPMGQDLPDTPERAAAAKRQQLAYYRLRTHIMRMEIARTEQFTDPDAVQRVADLKKALESIEKKVRELEVQP